MYICVTSLIDALDWQRYDFQNLKKLLKPDLPHKVVRTAHRGRGTYYYQVAPLCEWLDRVLPHGLGAIKTRAILNRSEYV